MTEMANCARCGASTPASRGTYTEEGLICQGCTDAATEKDLDTKKGAKYGFWTGVVIGITMRALSA